MYISDKLQHILVCSFIAIIIFISYYPCISSYFVCDDLVIIKSCIPHNLSDIFRACFASDVPNWQHLFLRPVIKFSFFVDYTIWKLNPLGYHLTNIVFHILTTLLIYSLSIHITQNKLISIFSGILFGLHYTHTGNVTWISGRTAVICSFFCFLALWTFILWRLYNKKIFYTLSLISFTIGLYSKETGVAFTGVLLVYWYLYERQNKVFRYLIPYIILGTIYLISRKILLGYITDIHWLFPPLHILMDNIAYYIEHLCLPVDIGILFCLGLLGIFKHKASQFTFFWIIFSLIPIWAIKGERFLYTSAGGFSILTGIMLLKYFNMVRSRFVKIIIVILGLIILISHPLYLAQKNTNWKIASKLAIQIGTETLNILPSRIEKHIYFLTIPDSLLGGGYIYRCGLREFLELHSSFYIPPIHNLLLISLTHNTNIRVERIAEDIFLVTVVYGIPIAYSKPSCPLIYPGMHIKSQLAEFVVISAKYNIYSQIRVKLTSEVLKGHILSYHDNNIHLWQ